MRYQLLAVLVILAGCSKPAPKLPASATVKMEAPKPTWSDWMICLNPEGTKETVRADLSQWKPPVKCEDFGYGWRTVVEPKPKMRNALYSSEANFTTDEGKRVVIGWVGLCGTETDAYGASATTGGLPDVQITLAPCPPPPAPRKKGEKPSPWDYFYLREIPDGYRLLCADYENCRLEKR